MEGIEGFYPGMKTAMEAVLDGELQEWSTDAADSWRHWRRFERVEEIWPRGAYPLREVGYGSDSWARLGNRTHTRTRVALSECMRTAGFGSNSHDASERVRAS